MPEITKATLFNPFKRAFRTPGDAQAAFETHQDNMLIHIYKVRRDTNQSYLGEWEKIGELKSWGIHGKLVALRGRIGKAYRRRVVPLYGYGPEDTQLIVESDVNLSSSTHWRKVRTVRWMEVYLYCEQVGLDFNNMNDWAEAAKTIDIEKGNISIWDILGDT